MKKPRNRFARSVPPSRRALARLLRRVRGTVLGVIPAFRRRRAANDPQC
jgi:hypothetical protein